MAYATTSCPSMKKVSTVRAQTRLIDVPLLIPTYPPAPALFVYFSDFPD